MPLQLFPRQREMVEFLDARLAAKEDGLVEKSRDIGFTWVTGGWALHKWLFVPGAKIAFGSRTEDLVDRIGDPDSIFEKIRIMLRGVPRWMRPANFFFGAHSHYLRLINPENSNVIRGEGGKNIGRGGRSTAMILDEFAFLENAASVDRATSGNTDTRIFGSSVNTPGDAFARKRHGGSLRPDQIFRFHYTDDPRKTPEWAAKKKASMEDHDWASEYDIDYSASVDGICIPAKWVDAAVTLPALLEENGMVIEPKTAGTVGGDVGGGGKAKSVAVARFGPIVTIPEAWSGGDTIETAHRLVEYARAAKVLRADGTPCTPNLINYDSVGVGKGVLDTMKHVRLNEGLKTVGVNVGLPPTDRRWPDKATSKEKFANLKAELWWMARSGFKASYEMMRYLQGHGAEEGGVLHELSDLIILPALTTSKDAMILAGQLSLVKWFRNEKGKIIMESKDKLASRGIASPDYAEAFVLTFLERTSSAVENVE